MHFESACTVLHYSISWMKPPTLGSSAASEACVEITEGLFYMLIISL